MDGGEEEKALLGREDSMTGGKVQGGRSSLSAGADKGAG